MCVSCTRMRIKAIHDVDLVEALERLEVYEGVRSGVYSCIICGRRITLDNLGAIVKLDEVKFVCDDPACLYKVAKIARVLQH